MTNPVLEDDVVERLQRWAVLAGDDQSVLKRDLLEAVALIEQQRKTIAEFAKAIVEGDEAFDGDTWDRICRDAAMINPIPGALLQGDKKE